MLLGLLPILKIFKIIKFKGVVAALGIKLSDVPK